MTRATVEANASESHAKRSWQWLRWPAFGLVCVVGGSFAAAVPRDGYRTVGALIGAWAVGAIAVAVWVHLLGLVRYGVERARHRSRSYSSLTYSPLILVIVFAMAFLSAVGKHAQLQQSQADESATASTPIRTSGVGSTPELTAAQVAFVTFEKAYVRCQDGPGKSLAAANKRTLSDVHTQRVSSVHGDFAQGLAAARAYSDCLARLPHGSPALRSVTARLAHAGSLFVDGWSLYVRGFGPPVDQAMLDSGDSTVTQAATEAKRAADDGDALYQRLGGAAALGDQLAQP